MHPKKKRVLIIGLDGATFDLITPWAADGRLPHLAQLMAAGCHGHLASTIQPTTAPAWVTFMTGMNQGKHGLYDFVRRRQHSYNLEVTSAAQVSAPTLFDIASQQGKHVVAVNVPYTSPPRPVNGVMIGGPFAPTVTRDLFYPPLYHDAILKMVPDYFILPDYNGRARDPMADYAARLMQGIEYRERISLHLLRSQPWDLFMVVFMATDEVQHSFWHCLEAPDGSPEARYRHTIRHVYQRIDEAIGKMLEAIAEDGDERETAVLLVSDHGAGPFRWMINLNRWLAEAGYLQFRRDNASGLRRLKTKTIKRLALAYRRYLPAQWRAAMRARLGSERFQQVKGEFESALMTASVAWEETQAYALGAGGNIYVNVKGREPAGIVEPDTAYEQVRTELARRLMTLREPETGEAMVRRVYRREELYQGPFLEQAPDLVIEWTDYAFWGRGQYDSQSPVFQKQRQLDFSDQPLTGSHRPQGILIAQGAGIRAGQQVEGARLLDVAPTVLSLLGIAPTPAMDGRFLTDLFTEDEAKRIQAAAETAVSVEESSPDPFQYSSEEEEQIAEHLRSLGYL